MIRAIAARELRLLFASPIAWVVLAVVQFLMAYVFLTRVELFMQYQPRIAAMESAPGVTEVVVAPLLGTAGIVMLLVAPLLTMRTLAEERRGGTLVLLLASPAGMVEIVLGKFLGLAAFFAVMAALIAAMPLSLLLGASLDLGQLGGGLGALALLLATFAAIGLFLSSLTDHPTVAGISTFGALLGLWIIDWAGETRGGPAGSLLGYLSIMRHYEPMLRGLVESTDVVYFLLAIGSFLTLTVWRLEADRLYRSPCARPT